MSFLRFRLKCLAVIAATLLLVAVDGNAAPVNEGSKYPLVSVETADELFGDDYDEETSQRYIGVTTPLAAGGNPWMDVNVIDTKHQRPTFPLEDNFYAASNHDWLVEVDSQGIKSRYDVFDDVNGDVNIKLARLLEDRSYISHDSSICQKVYDMVKNWNRRDKIGLAPLKAEVDAIEAIQTLEDMDKYLIGEEVPASGLIEPNMETDLNDSSRYVISINPMGLTLGDSAEYQKLTALGKRTKKANDTAAKKMLLLLRYDESSVKQKVDAMYRLEYALAGKFIPRRKCQRRIM